MLIQLLLFNPDKLVLEASALCLLHHGLWIADTSCSIMSAHPWKSDKLFYWNTYCLILTENKVLENVKKVLAYSAQTIVFCIKLPLYIYTHTISQHIKCQLQGCNLHKSMTLHFGLLHLHNGNDFLSIVCVSFQISHIGSDLTFCSVEYQRGFPVLLVASCS